REGMRYRALIAVSATLLLLWSCGESSLLMGDVDEPARVEVRSVSAGAVVDGAAEIPIRVARDPVYTGDESTVDRLLVELLDHEGAVLAEQIYDAVDEAADLPPVALPGLEPGLYSLRTTYTDGEEVVSEQTIPFFVVEGTYRILGLTSYPASSYPQADGLLRVSLDAPVGADPLLVWWLDDEVIESGYLSETGRTVSVLAPEAQGVFPVRVEVYPVWPEGADFRSVPAPESYSSELYVSESPSLATTDFAPARSYFALYHLRGTLRDEGARTEWFPSRDFTATPVGEPELAARNDVFGYALDGASGLESDGAVWPVFDGELSPVSMSFRLLADSLGGEATLLTIATRVGDLAAIVVGEDGRVGLRLAMIDTTVWSDTPVIRTDAVELVTVSVVPGSETGTVSFFSDGYLVSSSDVPGLSLDALDSPRILEGADRWSLLDGTTTIGAAQDGFVGIVDEFGVYFRTADDEPGTNGALFEQSMRSVYGDRLLYAASFDGEAELDSVETSGDVTVSEGALQLPAGSSVTFPAFEFGDEDLLVELDLRAEGSASLRILDAADGAELASVPLDTPSGTRSIGLRLTDADGSLTLTRDDEARDLPRGERAFEGVRLALTVADDQEPGPVVSLQSIVAHRDRPRIPERVFEVSGD
ncbi:MAG: hypothetical protein ACOC6J_11490, partial [Spirochaetota bacterium]